MSNSAKKIASVKVSAPHSNPKWAKQEREIIDKLKAGQENLDVINWALDNRISMDTVRDILEKLDINSRRLAHRFDL